MSIHKRTGLIGLAIGTVSLMSLPVSMAKPPSLFGGPEEDHGPGRMPRPVLECLVLKGSAPIPSPTFSPTGIPTFGPTHTPSPTFTPAGSSAASFFNLEDSDNSEDMSRDSDENQENQNFPQGPNEDFMGFTLSDLKKSDHKLFLVTEPHNGTLLAANTLKLGSYGKVIKQVSHADVAVGASEAGQPIEIVSVDDSPFQFDLKLTPQENDKVKKIKGTLVTAGLFDKSSLSNRSVVCHRIHRGELSN